MTAWQSWPANQLRVLFVLSQPPAPLEQTFTECLLCEAFRSVPIRSLSIDYWLFSFFTLKTLYWAQLRGSASLASATEGRDPGWQPAKKAVTRERLPGNLHVHEQATEGEAASPRDHVYGFP